MKSLRIENVNMVLMAKQKTKHETRIKPGFCACGEELTTMDKLFNNFSCVSCCTAQIRQHKRRITIERKNV